MTSGDVGFPIDLRTGLTGDPAKDYNIPGDGTPMLFLAPVTTPPSAPVSYLVGIINPNRISATYHTIGPEFTGSNGGYYYVQLRIIGPSGAYLNQSAVDKKFINPGFPT